MILLHIDTATENASICLSENNNIVECIESKEQNQHATFVHVAIQNVIVNANINLQQIDAIAVTNGPGSYTGLRVGLATAKGLCFALNKPLITLNTLQVIANSIIETQSISPSTLICPMIDARRMEVFTALYNTILNEVSPTTALIVEPNSFAEQLKNNTIIFCGNGSAKCQSIITNANAVFSSATHNASNMINLATEKFLKSQFDDVAYAAPFYGKEFYTTATIKN